MRPRITSSRRDRRAVRGQTSKRVHHHSTRSDRERVRRQHSGDEIAGGAQAVRAPRPRPAARRPVRGRSSGCADVPRSRRTSGLPPTRGPDLASVRRAPGAGRGAPGLARNQGGIKPLSAEESEALATWHLTELDDAGLVERVVERGEGNLLFVEQLAAVLAEGGPSDAVPPTVEGLLAARLDLLEARPRDLLQCASVIGSSSSSAGLTQLDADGEVGPTVLDLLRHGLIEPGETGCRRRGRLPVRTPARSDVTYAGTLNANETSSTSGLPPDRERCGRRDRRPRAGRLPP